MKGAVVAYRSAQSRKPEIQYLLAKREVKHYLDDPATHQPHSVTEAKGLRNLAHQMRFSIEMLQRKLEDEGKYYDLMLLRDERMQDRWHLFANGMEIAVLDDDFGYNCFDVSSTRFLERVEEVFAASEVEPLSENGMRVLRSAKSMASIMPPRLTGYAWAALHDAPLPVTRPRRIS